MRRSWVGGGKIYERLDRMEGTGVGRDGAQIYGGVGGAVGAGLGD